MGASIKDRTTDFARARWSDFQGFSPGQKAVTVAAVLALAVGGYFLLTWKASPTYAPLYTNLAASDASAVVDKLNASGVPYQLGQGGTEILVPQDKVYSTRLAMSSAGLPNSGGTGYSLLDKEGVTTSEFKQQIDYQRALEGELARTMQSINGVQAASVHLAIPQQDVFNDGSTRPSAAVLLSVAPGTQLTPAQVQSVVYLVSSSVPQMQASDVTVTDSNGNLLKAPGDTMAAGSDSQAQMTQDYDNRIAASLQAMLDRTVGPGHAYVTVNSQLDFNKTSTTSKKYVYNKNTPPLSIAKTSEVYNGAGAANGGTLGTQTTNGTTTTNGGGNYKKSSVTEDPALDTITQTTENAPGQLQNLAVSVVLDSAVKGANASAIANAVKASVGYTPARGDQVSVQQMPFDQTQQILANKQAKIAAAAAAAKQSHDQLMSMIKQGALALLVVIALVWVWLGGRKRKKAAAVEENDDVLGLEEFEDEQGRSNLRVVTEPANLRRSLATVADNRPKDVARLLSDWLESKGK